MASNPVAKVTEEQYLALDRAAEIRSEFLDGEMFAMAGASLEHLRLQQNISSGLDLVLRGKGCEVFGSDMRVRVSHRMYVYPDVTVVCGNPMLADDRRDILVNPTVLFVVLSPSTQTYDRAVKSQRYRTIESLREYVVVAQDQVLVEHYVRQNDNTWNLQDLTSLDQELKLASIGASLTLRRIYDRIEFPAT